MALDLTQRELADQRRGLIGWSIGLLLLVLLIALSWPAIEGMKGLDDLAANYPESVKELFGLADPLTSPSGYLNSQLYAYFFPVLLLVYSIGKGARTVAGEEEDGRMEVLSSLPLSRSRIVVEKMLAIIAGTVVLGFVTWLGIFVTAPLVGLEIGTINLLAATTGSVLVAVAGGLLALAAGSVTGRRGTAIAVAAGFVAITYILQGLAPVVDALSWSKALSFIYWAQKENPLRNGFDATSLAVLITCAIVFGGVAVFGFRKRDLRI